MVTFASELDLDRHHNSAFEEAGPSMIVNNALDETSMRGKCDGSSELKEGEMFLFLLYPRCNFVHFDNDDGDD